jgi:hypothetical protein
MQTFVTDYRPNGADLLERRPSTGSIGSAPELIVLVGEEHVEAGQ